jgi:septum formation protein
MSNPRIEPPLILASASPRRRDLLTRAGVSFEVRPADIVEDPQRGELPEAFARRLAREKAQAVAAKVGATPRRLVLGADTIVVVGERILGKPRDAEHAVALLRQLVGREHEVITAIAIVDSVGDVAQDRAVVSRVQMRDADESELRSYVATGEPLDKAGAYALQGEGRRFVTRVIGSESNVIGLPLEETLALLRECAAPGPEAEALRR